MSKTFRREKNFGDFERKSAGRNRKLKKAVRTDRREDRQVRQQVKESAWR